MSNSMIHPDNSTPTIAVSGSDPQTLLIFRSWLSKTTGKEPWVLWDASVEQPPAALVRDCAHKLITFKAYAYAAECLILSTQRIVGYENVEHVWIVDTDELTIKQCPNFAALQTRTEDVVLGDGYSRFSRKALQTISRDFGSGLDYSSLSSCVLCASKDEIKSAPVPVA